MVICTFSKRWRSVIRNAYYFCAMQYRYALELAYRGTRYYGWQRQPNEISVQEVIEKNLSKLFGNAPIVVVGCGRTDTGVHAAYYVAHVDLPEEVNTEQLTYKLNKMFPEDICVFAVSRVSDDFHARFSAKSRSYRYFIHQKKSPFLEHSLHLVHSLDISAMNKAAEYLLGTQDFTSLSKLHTDVKTNRCTVSKAVWKQAGDQWYFEIEADRFLRNMVRATVGTLLDVGYGKLEVEAIPLILDAKDRGAAKVSVPAKGLFLWNVVYDHALFSSRHKVL